VARSARAGRVREWALVLQAMGIDHEVAPAGNGGNEALILVREQDEARARAELELYERENRAWPAPEELPAVLTEAALGVVLWCLTLFLAFFAERNQFFGLDWWASGKLVAAKVRGGEWWRVLTALSLHDDLLHLASNMLFGALFVGIVCQVMGTGLALFSVVTVGALGNLANAWLRGADFSAIGASTAVFGALGILGGYRAVHRARSVHRSGRRRALVPLLACVFLLGAYGSGGSEPGDRIDVLGHALGFTAGLAAGALYGRLGSGAAPADRGQLLFGAAALAALAGAWWLALGG
jgi:membrane associated rhomboid family serine protease